MKYWILLFVVFGVNIRSVECISGCTNRWQTVFENAPNGTALFGSKRQLIHAALNGAAVRLSLDDYFVSVSNVKTVATELCAQVLFNVGYGHWSFPQNVTWIFVEICTNGYSDNSLWYVGRNEKLTDFELSRKVRWFIRKTGCDNELDDPRISKNREITSYDFDYVKSAVQEGADITIADMGYSTGYSTKFDNIVIDKDDVRGQDLWHLGSIVVGNHFSFEDDQYLIQNYRLWSIDKPWYMYFTLSTSNGSIGAFVNEVSTRTEFQKWYLDECWDLVYHHDSNGEGIEGSLDFLRAAVENGQKIKLVRGSNSWSMVPNQVNIRNGHVHGLFLNSIAFVSNPYWYWQEVSTTGRMRVTRYSVGTFQARGGQSVHTTDGKWFVSSRRYRRVFSNDADTGTVIHGSVTSLISAIRLGGEVRIGLPDKSLYFEADSVGILDENNVVAMHVRSVGLEPLPHPNSDFQFEIPASWTFKVVSTTGQMETAKRQIMTFESGHSITEQVAIDWFVCN